MQGTPSTAPAPVLAQAQAALAVGSPWYALQSAFLFMSHGC